jgi:hypothetical protein
MKGFLLGFLFLSGVSHGAQLSVKDFNFDYKDPHGYGKAASFSRAFIDEEVSVRVEKYDNNFEFIVSGGENGEFLLENAPAMLTNAQSMAVKGFNLDFKDRLVMSLTQATIKSDSSMSLKSVKLECDRAGSAELMDQVISGCINKMSLKSSQFSSQAVEGLLETLAGVAVNSVEFKSSTGKYTLSADVKAQVSGKVKSNGNISYNEKTGLLTIKISEVKFGLFNITGKVFDELKKNQSETLKVKEPYVYYQIK